MLTYLVKATGDLLATCILIGLAFGYGWSRWEKGAKRVLVVGLLAGFAFAIVMAILKQWTNRIDTGLWNMRLFVVCFVFLVVFLLSFIRPLAKALGKRTEVIRAVALAGSIFCRLLYKLPDVINYPANFNLGNNSIFSTDFFYRFIGLVVGIVLVALLAYAVFKISKTLGGKVSGIPMLVVLLVINVLQVSTCVQTMLARRIIMPNHSLFLVVKFFSNNEDLFTFVICALALACVVALFLAASRANEPYDNPAQHRKIRAKWRNRRRWAVCVIVCLIFSLVNITAVKAYDSREVELSPSEECEIRDGACYVPLEQVEDYHLHRFTYTTENNVGIRFIIIRKPAGTSYGIGLDACDICGETGYFERDGQVVCKLCDVVMNINTIGFKGGCNPIVIPYSIEDGYIVVPIDGLVEYEEVFTR